jgi:hypothetical protein
MFEIILNKIFFSKKNPCTPLRDGLINDDNFLDSSVISRQIILIFELNRDIDETFCVQSFSSIGCNCEELSCKRPDTLTDSIVYSLIEYTKRNEIRIRLCIYRFLVHMTTIGDYQLYSNFYLNCLRWLIEAALFPQILIFTLFEIFPGHNGFFRNISFSLLTHDHN